MIKNQAVREQIYPWRLHLIVLPPNADTTAVSDPTQSEGEHLKSQDRTPEQSAATNENKSKSSWKSTAYASAKVVIDVVKESSDAFPPLKSAVGGLAAILKHCDVRSVSLAPSMVLTIVPANDGQSENDRIVDTSD